MLRVTRDLILPTAITGSYPRPLWYDASLAGRSFKSALGDSLFREQYLDAVASIVAGLIRKALEYIPAERLVITTDCGFGREGLSRRIAYYKCVALVEGTNIVRRELGLPEARVRAADPRLWFAS
ncbi:MAG TPA: hypothetical protein VMS64_22820 [Candidatus Methylomirabilis sp.]|nr:hypothetical protein [Candidatus Methylomirabilis sp.]